MKINKRYWQYITCFNLGIVSPNCEFSCLDPKNWMNMPILSNIEVPSSAII